MDNFNNFFDNVNGTGGNNTPVYHTPDNGKGDRKMTPVVILFIVIALLMCLAIIVNVVVLAVVKDEIAAKYAASMSESIRSEYDGAILDYLDKNNITEDMWNSVKEEILGNYDLTAAEVAGKETIKSVARITATNNKSSAIATGFLITDIDSTGTRYLVTNAHAVLYAASRTSMALYSSITCTFENDHTVYRLEPVYVGGYYATYESFGGTSVVYDSKYDYTSLPDLAILRFVSTAPSDTDHPSLSIAASDYSTYGDNVALVGYPNGELMVTSGCVSQPAHTLEGWGYGDYYTTDAAINSGNSGGPLINRNGTVIGVAESKLNTEEYENIGYAVSAETLIKFIADATNGSKNELGKNVDITYNRIAVKA